MIVHIVYVSLVLLIGLLSLLILGPGSVLTFAFLIGIITVPLAFLLGIIPLVGLTLVFSLPFYLGLAFVWPTRPTRLILGSIALAMMLSAGISFAARMYLANASQKLISSDISETVDVRKKHVLVTNVFHPGKCGQFCQDLLERGGAGAVTLSEQSYGAALAGGAGGQTFGRLRPGQTGCIPAISAERSTTTKQNSTLEGRCIGRLDLVKMPPTLLITEPFKVLQFEEDSSWSFDPFEVAITAERVLVFDLTTALPTVKIQQTSVDYFPPFPVLWPIAIGKGPHSSSQRGLFRQTVETKSAPEVTTLIIVAD